MDAAPPLPQMKIYLFGALQVGLFASSYARATYLSSTKLQSSRAGLHDYGWAQGLLQSKWKKSKIKIHMQRPVRSNFGFGLILVLRVEHSAKT